MSLHLRFACVVALSGVVAGCWTTEDAVVEAPPDTRLNPLDKAASEPWIQQVLFVAEPGERVEALSLTTGTTVRPIVALAKADGSHRVVVIDGPGQFHLSGSKLAVGAADGISGNSPDGSWRATVSTGEAGVQVTLTDKVGAGGRVLALRDDASRKLFHPTVSEGGGAVYLAETGELGGIYRIALPVGPAVRIVPEGAVSVPLVWGAGDAERLVYAEQTDVVRILVAVRPGDPPKPASQALRAAGVPSNLAPAVRTASGGLLRPSPCVPVSALTTSAAGDAVTVGTVTATQALPCQEGCLALVSPSGSGAPRIVATIVGTGPARDVWFDPSVGLASGIYADADNAAATTLDVCVPPLADGTWLATVLSHASSATNEVYDHFSNDGSFLVVHGKNRMQPIRVLLNGNRDPILKPVLTGEPTPDPVASTGDGSVHATVKDSAIVWWSSRAEDDKITVLEAAPERAPVDVTFDDPGTLYYTDNGVKPGLYRLTLKGSRVEGVLPWAGLRHPSAVGWDGQPVLGVIRNGVEAVVTRPLTATERAAWNEGPITLARAEPSWSPVEEREGTRVRCSSGDDVTLGLDEQGGYLTWGSQRVAVRAASVEAGVLRVLADDAGVPSVVAVLRLDGDVGHWWPRSLRVNQVAHLWMTQAQAAALPDGGACVRRP